MPMIPIAPLFITDDVRDTHIDDINRDIEKLNQLIKIYNSASFAQKAETLLQVHQELHRLDANIGGVITVYDIASNTLNYDEFYKLYSTLIHDEFKSLGSPGFSTQQINQWDIENCRTNENIPSALLFEEETKPDFFVRIFGAKTSTPIKKATYLLSRLNPGTIYENTEDNYYQLSNLKKSLRELIAYERISIADRGKLNRLTSRINNRLFDIVENNLQLRSKVYPPESANLAQSIGNLSYENARELTNTLAEEDSFNADAFHQKYDFIPGLENYSIKFLGGVNAKNYLLENPETGERLVLKVTPNQGNSRKSYERLKTTSVNAGIADVYSSVNGIKGKTPYIYSLELTEFCNKGDVLSHGLKIQEKIERIERDIASQLKNGDSILLKQLYNEFGLGDKSTVTLEDKQKILSQLQDTRILNTTNIYNQMTDILLNFQTNNAFFPDAKPSNFLINEFDEVLIADTKTFVDTNNGIVNPRELQKNVLLQYSPGFRSPQFEEEETFSAAKEHAYLMGISLYCYITGTDIDEVPDNSKDHPAFLNFKKNVFQSDKGRQFKALIEGLTQHNPDERLSLQQAKEKLNTIAHGIIVEASPFKSKTEAYFFALHNLMEMAKKTKNESINHAINEMKILIENHEQDPKVAAEILNDLASQLVDTKQQTQLQNIAAAIKNSAYEQTLEEKYENPLARRFESEMQIALLKKPTDKMMQSVEHVSKALLNVFDQIEKDYGRHVLEGFASRLSDREPTGFGSQPAKITFEEVKKILQENNPDKLNQILYIHFLFAQKYMRRPELNIRPPNQNRPSGKLLELVKQYNNGEYQDNPEDFFKEFDHIKAAFISNDAIYGSELFRADPTRGREGGLKNCYSNQMGVMLLEQNQEGLGTDNASWIPDSKYQDANLHSPFTRDLIENDAVYAAGPSGMTSLFLGIMENYGNFESVSEKQNYFAAVSAHMVSGGLHSLHEMLGTAQYGLDLIPGYNISPPDKYFVASPPNFHQFYQQQMALDPQFNERYESGWDNMMAAYAKQKDQFIHAPISGVSTVYQNVLDTSKTVKKENPFENITEAEFREILSQKPELNKVKINNLKLSSWVGIHGKSKEDAIQANLFKIQMYALKGDDANLNKAIDDLFKVVCKKRTSFFESYSTSTTSAENLINEISQDEKLRRVFGILGDNPAGWRKQIKAKMEAAYKNETIPSTDFSPKS